MILGSPKRQYQRPSNVWQWLALDDSMLEQSDLVEINLTIASGIPGLESLDIENYVRIVDGWTDRFRRQLPDMERMFRATPNKWKNDIDFFRVGMLMGFLGFEIGIRYNDEQFAAQMSGNMSVCYVNAGDLFLHGLIDTKQGTCGNMAALHVAISRRMGWNVSLACVKSHFISRFERGAVYHNIEATGVKQGCFVSDPDDIYIEKFKLPKRATHCGSDLRSLSMREMIGVFFALRARHYSDTDRHELADLDYALSRVLFHNHRRSYIGAMVPMIRHGATLFDEGELGHPDSLFEDFAPQFSPSVYTRFHPPTRTSPIINGSPVLHGSARQLNGTFPFSPFATLKGSSQ